MMKKYSSAPAYWFRPLHFHFDGGFGAVGDAFQEAALCLEGVLEENQFFNSYLPLAYLYRHAVELYLKSVIVIIHRNLKLPFGPLPSSSTPMIEMDEEWIPLGSLHSISKLYGYLQVLMDGNMARLLAGTTTDWVKLPEEFPNWIALIEAFDEKSTFIRRPGMGGRDESGLGNRGFGEPSSSTGSGFEATRGLFEFEEDEQVIGVSYRDRSGLDTILTVLRNAADQLSILHFSLRCELAGGT
jgi:hypothetical protein